MKNGFICINASYLNRRVPHPVSVGVFSHGSSDHVEFPAAAAQSGRTHRQQQLRNTRPAVLVRTVALHTGQTLTAVITTDHVQLQTQIHRHTDTNTHPQRHTHTHTHRDTHTHTQRERERERARHTHTDRHTHTHRDTTTHTHRYTHTQRYTQIHTHTHRQCWGKLLLKIMHYNIALLPKKVTNYVT